MTLRQGQDFIILAECLENLQLLNRQKARKQTAADLVCKLIKGMGKHLLFLLYYYFHHRF